MITELFFDVETKKLFSDIKGNDPGDLGVSVVSVYVRGIDDNFNELKGEIESYWEDDFEKLWPRFQEANRIIGFNSLGFDVLALKPHAPFDLSKLNHFDLLPVIKESLGRRIGLDALARETLDVQKTGVGVEAVYLWQKGDKKSLNKLRKYCEKDVLITKDLYDFGFQNGYLKYLDKWNSQKKVKVDFSYSEEELNSSKQSSLF